MRAGGGGVAAAVTKMDVLPFLSRAEQRPFKIPVHVPASNLVSNFQMHFTALSGNSVDPTSYVAKVCMRFCI